MGDGRGVAARHTAPRPRAYPSHGRWATPRAAAEPSAGEEFVSSSSSTASASGRQLPTIDWTRCVSAD